MHEIYLTLLEDIAKQRAIAEHLLKNCDALERRFYRDDFPHNPEVHAIHWLYPKPFS